MGDTKTANPFSDKIEKINKLNNFLVTANNIIDGLSQDSSRNPILRILYFKNHASKDYEFSLSDEKIREAFLEFIRQQKEKTENELTKLLGGN